MDHRLHFAGTLPGGDAGLSPDLHFIAAVVRRTLGQIDAGLSAGWTPTQGALAAYQKSAFLGGLIGSRGRFSGSQSLFATIAFQTANWQDTGWRSVDGRDVTLDAGGLVNFKQGWPEVQIGITEDLAPRGPAVDVGFKVGLRW